MVNGLALLENSGKRKLVRKILLTDVVFKSVKDLCACDESVENFGNDERNRYQYDLVIKLDRQVRRKEAIEDLQSQFQEAYMSTCPKSTPEGEHE